MRKYQKQVGARGHKLSGCFANLCDQLYRLALKWTLNICQICIFLQGSNKATSSNLALSSWIGHCLSCCPHISAFSGWFSFCEDNFSFVHTCAKLLLAPSHTCFSRFFFCKANFPRTFTYTWSGFVSLYTCACMFVQGNLL